MREIMTSGINGAIYGAKAGGLVSVSAFLTIAAGVTYDVMNDADKEDSVVLKTHQSHLLFLVSCMIFAPIVGTFAGGVVGTAKGMYTSVYGRKVKAEAEARLPVHYTDQLIPRRPTRINELS